MKIISFTAIFIAVLIVTVLSTNSAVSAMNTGSLKYLWAKPLNMFFLMDIALIGSGPHQIRIVARPFG